MGLRAVARHLDPSRLLGPVLGNELRIASRRRRTYLWRMLYIAALAGLILLTIEPIDARGSAAQIRAEMALMGARLTYTVMQFQFWAMQALAILLTVGAVQEDVRRRTLGMLLTTPVTGWQIAVGKLLSKLLPLGMLLAVSLPVLAVGRIFGGVRLEFVAAGLVLTAAAALFAGAVTLCFALCRRTVAGALLWSLFFYGGLFTAVPMLLLPPEVESYVVAPDAFYRLASEHLVGGAAARRYTYSYISSVAPPPGPSFYHGPTGGAGGVPPWLIATGVCVGMAAVMTGWAARHVRGAARYLSEPARRSKRRARAAVQLRGARRALAHVHGSPLLWKELRFYLPNPSRLTWVTAAFILAALLALDVANVVAYGSRDPTFHSLFVFLFFLSGLVVTVLAAGHAISPERESRALPLLLSLPVGDRDILVAKTLGVLYQALPCWGLVMAHVVIFGAAGRLGSAAWIVLPLTLVWVSVFLTGLGLFLGTRMRSGANAAAAVGAVAVMLWIVAPMLGRLLLAGGQPGLAAQMGRHLAAASPFAQIHGAIVLASADAGPTMHILPMPEVDPRTTEGVGVLRSLVCLLVYSGVGLCLLVLARYSLRKHALEA